MPAKSDGIVGPVTLDLSAGKAKHFTNSVLER